MKTIKGDIRPETFADYQAVDDLLTAAFQRREEGTLVTALRKLDAFIPTLSLVYVLDEKMVGYSLFSPITIQEHKGKEHQSLALAPMAVHPDYQKQGIASRLVAFGLDEAKRLGFHSVMVLGHPMYYPRFGFVPASRFKISPPFNVPDEAFMAISLRSDGTIAATSMVQYPSEFLAV